MADKRVRAGLLIVGDIAHSTDPEGRLQALAPVAAQLDRWAEQFDHTTVTGPLLPWPQRGFAPYRESLAHVPLPAGGGPRLSDKAMVIVRFVQWTKTLIPHMRRASLVHLRAPCNVSLLAIPLAMIFAPRRYAIFAGTWAGYDGEPISYRVQRAMLRSVFFRGPVHMYGAADRRHLRPFYSTSFTRAQWIAEGQGVEAKVGRLRRASLVDPLRLVIVGRLSENKNQALAIRAVASLVEHGIDARLEVVGSGECDGALRELVSELDLGQRVTMRGKLDAEEVWEAYRRADLNLLTTRNEGFGKVLLEGMVAGAIPVCTESPVSLEITDRGSCGRTFPVDDLDQLVATLTELAASPAALAGHIGAARAHTESTTLEAFAADVRALLEDMAIVGRGR